MASLSPSRFFQLLCLTPLATGLVASITPSAGPDQTIVDLDDDGKAFVTLDGSATLDPDNEIATVEWFFGSILLASGLNPTVEIDQGSFTLTLSITDQEGQTLQDTVQVTVRAPIAPSVKTAPAIAAIDDDFDGFALVTLDATDTFDPDGVLTRFDWRLNSETIAEGALTELLLRPDTYNLVLVGTALSGQTYTDTVTVEVLWIPSVSADGHEPSNGPENTLDNDPSTQWIADGSGQLTYDLHMTTRLEGVRIAFDQGAERVYNLAISTSLDGSAWTGVFDGQSSGSSVELETFDFDDTLARFVRIEARGNQVDAQNSYSEVRLDWALSNHDGNANALPDAWEQVYHNGLLADVTIDLDGDGFNAIEEWTWGTNPRDAGDAPDFAIDPDRPGIARLTTRAPYASGIGYVDLVRHYTLETSLSLEAGSWGIVQDFDVEASDRTNRTVLFPVSGVDRFLRILMSLKPVE